MCIFFFFNDPATTEIYTLSLHDALPICPNADSEVDPAWAWAAMRSCALVSDGASLRTFSASVVSVLVLLLSVLVALVSAALFLPAESEAACVVLLLSLDWARASRLCTFRLSVLMLMFSSL